MYQQLLEHILGAPIQKLQLMAGGSTAAQNYYFEVNEKIWLLRIFNPEHSLTERRQESLISELVGAHHISGKVIYKNDNCLVREYLSGQTLNYTDLHNRVVLKTIVTLLKTQHNISTENLIAAPSCQQRIQHHLESAKLPALFTQLKIDFDFTEKVYLPALIHNDLHNANILLHQNKIQFIDWSLAGIGNVFSDLAEIAIYLEEKLREYILECYFGNTIYKVELNHACQARLLLFAAWALNMAKITIDPVQLKKPKTDFTTWIKRLTNNECQLNCPENFIDFATSCIEKFRSDCT